MLQGGFFYLLKVCKILRVPLSEEMVGPLLLSRFPVYWALREMEHRILTDLYQWSAAFRTARSENQMLVETKSWLRLNDLACIDSLSLACLAPLLF